MRFAKHRLVLSTSLTLVLACKGDPDADTTDPGSTGTGSSATSNGTDTSLPSSSSTSPTSTTDVEPTGAETTVTDPTGTTTTATVTTATDTSDADTSDTGTTDTDTVDPTAADPVCGVLPAPGDTFMIDFGGEIGLQTFEEAGNTGCHDVNNANSMLISLVWTSTTNGGFSIGAALFSGDYDSLGELVGNTMPYAPGNQLNSEINAPGLGSYEAVGANFGVHISSLTEEGITGCLVGVDAFVRKADNLELTPGSTIPFACAN